MPRRQTPSRKKKAVLFTNVTTNAYQGQLNAGFSKVFEIFKVRRIESESFIREFHTPVCYCGDISTPRNVTLNETNYDWNRPMKAEIYSRPSAVRLKVWLRETTTRVTKKHKLHSPLILEQENLANIASKCHIFYQSPICHLSYAPRLLLDKFYRTSHKNFHERHDFQ